MIPTVAIVGRPNVGKSTLLNRLARRRVSIVHGRPGVTRDRIAVEVEWDAGSFELVDTGGLGIVDRHDLSDDIHEQIDLAVAHAALVIFVVDARSGLHALDEEVARLLRERHVPVILAANKCETNAAEHGLGEFYGLGVGDPLPISAQHGEGMGVLTEAIEEALPKAGESRADPALKIAIVGRRNAGKSTFINALLGEERVIVSDIPGTTRDSVDVRFEKDGQEFVAIDTAGILRRTKLKDNVEFYAQVRSMQAIRRSDVAILLIDGEHGVSQLDKRIAHELGEVYRACVIGVNKWDLVKDAVTTGDFEEYLSKALPGLSFAPIVYLTAKDGRNVGDVISVAQSLAKQSRTRVGTGEMNRVLEEIRGGPTPRVRASATPKIYYGTQVGVSPPTFTIFVNKPGFFSPQYRRTIENRFRDLLPFPEIPLKIIYRQRESKARG